MSQRHSAVVLAVIVCLMIFNRASAQTLAAADNADLLDYSLREIFRAKCSECHNPTSRHETAPNAVRKWKDWQDLAALKQRHVDKDFSLKDSSLWGVLHDDDPKTRMPPAGAKGGALTEREIKIIGLWIQSGAPIVAQTQQTAANVSSEKDSHLLAWLGKFHPVVVHFPIALLLLAALGELATMLRVKLWPSDAARFCLWLAAASAVLAAALGWLAGEWGGPFGETIEGVPILEIHRWLGIGATSASVLAAVLCEMTRRSGNPRMKVLFRVTLFVAAIAVGVTGHFGGLLVFGADYFGW